ncbi:MAG: hypothetical protein V4727_09500 [Verrucomicrobiota bacterium]
MNFQFSVFITAILACVLFVASCADKPTATPPTKPKKEEVRLVGRIASIHKNHNFVLIQSYGTWNIQSGTILATIGPDGRAANLKVTGEKTGQYAAADIQSGALETGDSVYTTLTSGVIESTEESEPETPSETKPDAPEIKEEIEEPEILKPAS